MSDFYKGIIVLILVTIGCLTYILIPPKAINENSLIDRNGVKYQQDSKEPYSGKVFDLHSNSNMKIEGSYIDGKKVGIYTSWYDNGQKMAEEHYKDGIKVGEWIKWYDNGNLKERKHYHQGDGKLDGYYIEYYNQYIPHEQKYQLQDYTNGRKDGIYKQWYPKGGLAFEGRYEDGDRIGVWKWYEEGTGKLEHKETYKNHSSGQIF